VGNYYLKPDVTKDVSFLWESQCCKDYIIYILFDLRVSWKVRATVVFKGK